jgi:hypothetical protein
MKDNNQGMFRNMIKWQFREECKKKESTDI